MRQNVHFLLLLLPFISSGAVELTTTNGITVNGTVLSCSKKTGTIRMRANNGTTQLKLAELTDHSRQTINHWRADKNFKQRSSFATHITHSHSESITNLMGTVSDWRTGAKTERVIGHQTDTFRTYNIKLTNQSDTPFHDLSIDCRTFYTLLLPGEHIAQCQLASEAECDLLLPGRGFSFKSPQMRAGTYYSDAIGIDWTGRPADCKATILGTLICIRKRNCVGEWIEHEIEHGDVPRKRDRNEFQKLYE